MLRALIAVIFLGLWPVSMLAQDVAYVQVEAHPTLTTAQARARFYAGQLENVNGFSLGGGWYGVVLGPYTPNDANTVLRQMRRDRTIPSDSFIITGRRFQQQFWPVGVGAQTTAQPLPDATTPEVETVATIEVAPLAEVSAPVVIPTETRRQAQASEKLLDRDQRKNLQTALKWAGFYASAIDGAYGRGTRASMRAWQNANNAEPTGVLTTTQRATLLASYNAVLDGMGLTLVRDYASGIEMLVPTGVVAFSEYEPPFVRFDPKGNLDASVLFISQDGDQNRLFGLYEILQTLTIVPNDGPRKRDNRSFELEGIDDDIHSYTYAKLDNGTIKGFSLIWPAGDDERRRRVLDEMKASFVVLDGVLDPSLAAPSENQGIDQVSGLAVRKPKMSRTGFFINDAGTVLTTAEAVGSCDRISLNSEHDAQVVHLDDALGLAVLRPDVALSPLGVVTFQTGIPRLQTSVAVAGFPYGGVLVTPSLTFGRLADMRGLNGEETIKRLALTAQSGDAGGPVFDNAGSVLGMLLPSNESGGRVLPQDVSFSIDSDEILSSLNTAGIAAQTTDAVTFMSPETLTLRAADNTVLVSCW
jgi:peptidoglycan hydrolase-like protein with peptidoglycan-binding domain